MTTMNSDISLGPSLSLSPLLYKWRWYIKFPVKENIDAVNLRLLAVQVICHWKGKKKSSALLACVFKCKCLCLYQIWYQIFISLSHFLSYKAVMGYFNMSIFYIHGIRNYFLLLDMVVYNTSLNTTEVSGIFWYLAGVCFKKTDMLCKDWKRLCAAISIWHKWLFIVTCFVFRMIYTEPSRGHTLPCLTRFWYLSARSCASSSLG